MSDSQDQSQDESPNRVPGKWVLLAILLLGVATVLVAFITIRPIPGSKPAPAEDRPFGPASHADQRDIPLIQRKSPENLNGY